MLQLNNYSLQFAHSKSTLHGGKLTMSYSPNVKAELHKQTKNFQIVFLKQKNLHCIKYLKFYNPDHGLQNKFARKSSTFQM